ncbi:MAG TPA: hypothetical protein VMU39_07885 [Solirubrobacteraceae bacterium]|nr:hypothetical protein [Solirubrobacteraceae bacterium]
MPTFCRHNRMIQNCPICSREQQIELRPIVSSSAPRSSLPRTSAPRSKATREGGSPARPAAPSRASGGLKVRRLARGADDGYRSRLVPGVKSSEDAQRLAEELAFATARLERLEADPPGLYAEVADGTADAEERFWLAFLIAYLGPLDGADPFRSIEAARTRWASGEPPHLDDVELGPRTAHEPDRGTKTTDAYRAWALRSGSQTAAFAGESAWTPERRFERVFERMALPGFHRDARFDLLVTLGRLGLDDVRAGALQFGGENEVTVAAKRILGIGDPLLLERRALDLAQACGIPLDALDVGLFNWGRGERATLGMGEDADPHPAALESALAALDL